MRQSRPLPPEPPIGSTWAEKKRPKHTVEIVGVEPSRGHYPPTYLIVYKHIGVANKRVQSANTIREVRSFLGSYEPTDPDAVFIDAAEQEIKRLQKEVSERQDRIHELNYQILRRSQ